MEYNSVISYILGMISAPVGLIMISHVSLAKKIFDKTLDYFINKNMEKYKHDLSVDGQKVVEKYRNDLNVESQERVETFKVGLTDYTEKIKAKFQKDINNFALAKKEQNDVSVKVYALIIKSYYSLLNIEMFERNFNTEEMSKTDFKNMFFDMKISDKRKKEILDHWNKKEFKASSELFNQAYLDHTYRVAGERINNANEYYLEKKLYLEDDTRKKIELIMYILHYCLNRCFKEIVNPGAITLFDVIDRLENNKQKDVKVREIGDILVRIEKYISNDFYYDLHNKIWRK